MVRFTARSRKDIILRNMGGVIIILFSGELRCHLSAGDIRNVELAAWKLKPLITKLRIHQIVPKESKQTEEY